MSSVGDSATAVSVLHCSARTRRHCFRSVIRIGGDWPKRADGGGSTLQLIDVFTEYGDGENWRASLQYGGSPGSSESSFLEHVVINEALVTATDSRTDRVELYNSTRGPIDISGWYLSDSGSNPTKFRIPD